MDLSALNAFAPVHPYVSPVERMAKLVSLQNAQLTGQDIGAQIQERQASARKVADTEAKAQQIQSVLGSATWDETNGGLDEQTLRKIDAIDPQIGSGLRQHKQDWMTSAASQKNLESEALNRETKAERQAREAAALVPAPVREYQSWLKTTGRPDNELSSRLYKMQGKEVPAGASTITGLDQSGSPTFATAPEKTPPAKSLQAKDVVLKSGQRAMVNFDPGEGKYTDTQGNDVSAQVQGEYHVPPSTNPANAADSASYKFHVTELDKRAKPLDDSAARLSRLADTLDQGTAQADALIAPELMTVMAGGLGSGVRITNSEIERVQGGRPMIAQLQSKIRHWLSTDQKAAIDFGVDERKAMHDLVNVVAAKLAAKQAALTQAGAVISGEGTSDQQRRTALADLDKALRGIDSGSNATTTGIPVNPATGKPYAVGDLINGHKITAINAKGPVLAQ